MCTVSAHGGLVHVVLCGKSVTVKGVSILIENSPNLLTCYIYVSTIEGGTSSSMDGVVLRLKRKFSDAKLFCTERFHLSKPSIPLRENDVLIENDTDLISLWPHYDSTMDWPHL